MQDHVETQVDAESILATVVLDEREMPTVTPTLVIGLGGTGTGAIRYLKRRLVWLWHREEIEREMDRIPPGVESSAWHKEVWRRFEMEGGPPVIQLLAVDTVPWSNRPGEVYLNDFEYAYIGGYNATRVLENLERHPEIAEWWQWDPKDARPGQIHSGARQIRAIGRLSFYRRYRAFWDKLKPRIDQMTSLQAKQDMQDRRYQVATAGETKRVYIITSLCGGTGAGCFLDVAACLRGIAHFSEASIITGMFALPSVFIPELASDLQRDRVRANAYAALKEIAHFQSNPFRLWLPGETRVEVPILHNRLYLVERVNRAGESLNSIDDIKQLIANQVFLESITDVGSRIWEYDVNVTMERRQTDGRVRSYIFSSFANSSLVVPRDDMQEYCELRYAGEIIREVLLRELTPDDRNQLNADALLTLRRLERLVAGDSGESEQEEEVEEEEEGAWVEEGASSPTITSGRQRRIAPLEQCRQDLNRVIQEHGLPGAIHFLEVTTEGINGWVNRTRGQVSSLADQLERNTARRNNRETSPPRLAALSNVPLLSVFVRPLVRRYRNELAALRRAIDATEGNLTHATRQRDGWARLQDVLKPLPGQLNGRADLLRGVLEQQIERDIKRLFSTNRPTDQSPFEMFTILLGRAYIEQKLFPSLRTSLGQQLEVDARILLGRREICQVQQVTARHQTAGTDRFETILQVVPVDQVKLALTIESVARQTVRPHLDHSHPELLQIRNILRTGGSRIRTRLRDLFTRCQPFWRYDLDIGGHSETDMEEIVYAGVAEKDNRDWGYLLRDYGGFELAETDDPTRIDACRVVHGLPVEYLESLPDMKSRYDRFVRECSGPLHLDGRWEPDGQDSLGEIVLDLPGESHDDPDYPPPPPGPAQPAGSQPRPPDEPPSETDTAKGVGDAPHGDW